MMNAASSDPQAILRARARSLAASLGVVAAGPTVEVVEFGLAEERYALELGGVAEILPLDQLTPLPGTPGFLAGIINVRGRIVAVVDLKEFFELPAKGITDLHRVILLRQDDFELGVLADYVAGTRSVPVAALQPALPTLTGIRSEYLKGVTAAGLIVLEAQRILSDPKLLVNDAPAT